MAKAINLATFDEYLYNQGETEHSRLSL